MATTKVGFLFFSLIVILGGVIFLPQISGDIITGDSVIEVPDPPASFDPISTLVFVAENIGFMFKAGTVSSSIALLDLFFTILAVVDVYIALALLRGGS